MSEDRRLDRVASWMIVALLAVIAAMGGYIFQSLDRRLQDLSVAVDGLKSQVVVLATDRETLLELNRRVRELELRAERNRDADPKRNP